MVAPPRGLEHAVAADAAPSSDPTNSSCNTQAGWQCSSRSLGAKSWAVSSSENGGTPIARWRLDFHGKIPSFENGMMLIGGTPMTSRKPPNGKKIRHEPAATLSPVVWNMSIDIRYAWIPCRTDLIDQSDVGPENFISNVRFKCWLFV